MYQIETIIMHIATGVCKITDIREKQFTITEKQKYYVLQPIFETGTTLFVPVENNPVRIRPLLTKAQIASFMETLAEEEPMLWNHDDNQRQMQFKTVLKQGDPQDVLRMIYAIHLKQEQKKKMGKKLRSSDERVRQAAEKLIEQEFAYVLEIPQEKVADWIQLHLPKK